MEIRANGGRRLSLFGAMAVLAVGIGIFLSSCNEVELPTYQEKLLEMMISDKPGIKIPLAYDNGKSISTDCELDSGWLNLGRADVDYEDRVCSGYV